MALQKQAVNLEFSGGLQRQSDDFTVIPSKLTVLTNGRFVDKTTVSSRNGFSPLISNHVYDGSTIGEFRRLVKRGNELAAECDKGFAAGNVSTLFPSNGTWSRVASSLNRCSAEMVGVAHPPGDVLEMDSAGNVQSTNCIVWTDVGTLGGGFVPSVYVQVRFGEKVLLQQQLSTGGACCPRVAFLDTDVLAVPRFYIYWIEDEAGTGKLKCATIDINTTTVTVSAITTIEDTFIVASTTGATTGIPMIGYMDACANTYTSGGAIWLAHRSVAVPVGGVRFLKLDPTDGVTIMQADALGAATFSPGVSPLGGVAVCMSDFAGVGGPFYMAIVRSGTPGDGVTICSGQQDVGASMAAHQNGGTAAGKVTIVEDTINAGKIWAAWDEGTAGSTTASIAVAQAAQAGGGWAVSPATAVSSVGLGSAPFIYSNYASSRLFLGAYFYSTVQPTFFVIDVANVTTPAVTASSNDVCARASCLSAPIKNRWQRRGVPRPMGNQGGNAGGAAIPFFRSSQDVVSVGTSIPINNVADTNRTPVGADLMTLDFSATLNSLEVDQSAILAGGNPLFYDGQSLTELGFHYYPETPVATAGGVGTLPAGTYQVTCLYEWIDRFGLVHQSAPAVPVSVVVTLNQRITVTVPTLRLTKKSNVRIVIYRTIANGSTFYRYQGDVTYANSVANTTASNTIALASESITDAILQVGEFLPTTGGVVPTEAFPACKHVALHQDRIVFSGLLDREFLQYTEERQGAFFPSTNAGTYYLEVGIEAGRVSATVSMDDKLVVLQESAIGAFIGRGPNRLGLDNNLSNCIRLDSAYGLQWACSATVVQDSEGIWFHDKAGLRHLSRGMQVSQVQLSDTETGAKGCEVDALVATTTYGAVVLSSKKQVIFANSTSFLVWDMENRQWSQYLSSDHDFTFRYPFVIDDALVFMSSSVSHPLVLTESTTLYTDGYS